MRRGRLRTGVALALSALYLAAGTLHLTNPEPFVRITPRFVPAPEMVVAMTGVLEILGAIGLQVPALRRAAGVGLALYALCVWPANLRHAMEGIEIAGLPTGWWYHGPRLALQPVLVAAALYAGGWWPRRRSRYEVVRQASPKSTVD